MSSPEVLGGFTSLHSDTRFLFKLTAKMAAGCALFVAGILYAAEPANLTELRDEFEHELQRLDTAGLAQRNEISDLYLSRLQELELELQSQGQVRGLMGIHDEIARFAKTRIPPSTATAQPIELRELQDHFLVRWQQTQTSNQMEVVRLAGRYVQTLANLRMPLAEKNDKSRLKALDVERDRVLALPRLRQALKSTETTTDPQAYLAQNESAAGKQDVDLRALRLFHAPAEDLETRLGYEVNASLATDESKLRTRKGTSAGQFSHAEEGYTTYKPYATLICRNKELPSGCRMTISYYSRSLTDREKKRESIETFALPALTKGQTYSIDGKGITLYRNTAVVTYFRGTPSQSIQGSELFGLIIEVRDENGKTVLQRYTPQSLEREMEK